MAVADGFATRRGGSSGRSKGRNMSKSGALLLGFIAAAWIYGSDASVVSLSMKADKYPTQMQVPHVAWPGVSGLSFAVSGQHSVVLSAVLPDKLGSESAKGFGIVSKNKSHVMGINPVGVFSRADTIPFYEWEDWFIFPHNSFRVPFLHSPSLEEFHLGLGADSPIWLRFREGATFCAHSQTLNLKPSRVKSCLGQKIAVLNCARNGPLRCGAGEVVTVLGGSAPTEHPAVVSPFDQRIEFSSVNGTDACHIFRGGYYYDRSLVAVKTVDGTTVFAKRGEEVVAPSRATDDARLVSDGVLCSLQPDYLQTGVINVGLLGSGLSFVYSPEKALLEIWETKSSSMRDSWYDVIIINLALLFLVHWFFDEKKDVRSPWTYVPEILGFVVAVMGVWFQGYEDGAYFRVEDIPGAQTAVIVLFWVFSLFSVAHAASFLISLELYDGGSVGSSLAISNVRKFSYEAMLIVSIFSQALGGSMDVLDSYVAFMVGFSLVYNTSYRFAEMWFDRTNHWSVIAISFSSLAAASYIFYVTTSLPAMDPVASLSRFAHEASVLGTLSAFLFAVVERSAHLKHPDWES